MIKTAHCAVTWCTREHKSHISSIVSRERNELLPETLARAHPSHLFASFLNSLQNQSNKSHRRLHILSIMSSTQGQRIQTNCKIIWGDADYDLDLETDDWVAFVCVVKKDLGSHFGPPLTMTGLCNSKEQAWKELDRMLDVWARQVQSGQSMTKAQSLEIFGGPNGRNRFVLEKFLDEAKKRGRTDL
jgi:hypothetical protein